MKKKNMRNVGGLIVLQGFCQIAAKNVTFQHDIESRQLKSQQWKSPDLNSAEKNSKSKLLEVMLQCDKYGASARALNDNCQFKQTGKCNQSGIKV